MLAFLSAGHARAADEHSKPHSSPNIDGSALLKVDAHDKSDNARDWTNTPKDELARASTRHVAVVYAAAVDAATNTQMLAQVTAESDLTNESHSKPLALVARATLPVAEFHLNTLRGMTKSGPLAARVEDLQSRIDRAKAALAGRPDPRSCGLSSAGARRRASRQRHAGRPAGVAAARFGLSARNERRGWPVGRASGDAGHCLVAMVLDLSDE